MRKSLVVLFLTASASVMANEPGYRLFIETRMQGNILAVSPQLTAPAGRTLRYDMATTKEGSAGRSNTRQSGTLTVGQNGKAALSTVSVSVGEGESYRITVRVYEGERLVASESLTHPN